MPGEEAGGPHGRRISTNSFVWGLVHAEQSLMPAGFITKLPPHLRGTRDNSKIGSRSFPCRYTFDKPRRAPGIPLSSGRYLVNPPS